MHDFLILKSLLLSLSRSPVSYPLLLFRLFCSRCFSPAPQNRYLASQQKQRARADGNRFGNNLGDEGAGIQGWHQMSQWASDYNEGDEVSYA